MELKNLVVFCSHGMLRDRQPDWFHSLPWKECRICGLEVPAGQKMMERIAIGYAGIEEGEFVELGFDGKWAVDLIQRLVRRMNAINGKRDENCFRGKGSLRPCDNHDVMEEAENFLARLGK